MTANKKIINSISQLPVNDKLLIVEAILKSIRESGANEKHAKTNPKILELAGNITENETTEWQNAISEGRKIDVNEW